MTSEGDYVMCRTCLNYSFPFSNIFKELLGEGYIYEVLMDVCQLEVSSDDGFPEYVCFDCHKNLSKLLSFKMQTHESNAALHRFKIRQEIKIEPASNITSSTPNSDSSLRSTSRNMKECFVHLSRCDQLLQDGHSLKVNIKREKEDPSYLGDNESGSIQGADLEVNIKREIVDPSYLGDNESGSIHGADMQLPDTLVGEGESPSALEGASKEKLGEETLQENTQGVVNIKEVFGSENLFSNGNEIEGDDIEIHEEKLFSKDAFLEFLSPRVYLTGKSVKAMGNLTINNANQPSDEAYVEAEPQEIKETSENEYVAIDSNLQRCESDPEKIISRLLERSAHPGVELNLDQCYDEKSLVTVGSKIQEREHLEEIQLECEIFESLNHEPRSSECVDERGAMRESDKETIKSDNIHSKTYREETSLLEDSHAQLRKVNNRDFCSIVVCDHCRKEFKEKSDFLKHLVGFKRGYTCKRPQEIHKTNKDSVRHEEKHNLKACCSSQFIEKTRVMRESDKLNVKYDNLVRKTFRKRGSFCEDSNVQLREEENRDLLNILACDHCREEFHEKSDLLKHLAVHSGKSNFGRLSEKTESKGNIVLYTSDSTKKRGSNECKRRLRTKNQWECKLCGKQFAYASVLKTHERVHTGEKPFSCKYCSRMFRTKGTLSQHELIHVGVKPHVCTYCSKKFRRKEMLRYHELTHTEIKPFSCSYGSKNFNQKSYLNMHAGIHTENKPFSCNVCSIKFNQKSNLNRHKLIHTGVKPFSCSYCSRSFYLKSDLNVHVRIHTGVNLFSCKYCTKQFVGSSNLTNHELIHTGVKPFRCEYCSKWFRQKSHLKRHELTHIRFKQFS